MKTENEIARAVWDAAFKVHTRLGPGLLESVYETVLVYELSNQGIPAERQVPIPSRYENLVFEVGFRADVVVEDRVVVELKSVDKLQLVHAKQLLTQLKLSNRRLGLLINFGQEHSRDGIQRLVHGLPNN